VPVEPQARRLERHERILDAAAQVFATKGYHGTLVDEIALAAETSKGGVYFHFPNKQAIFLALLDRLAAMLRERIAGAIAAQGAPLERADAALRVVLETFGGHRRLARLFLVEALGAGPEFNARMLAIRAQFAGLIKTQLDAAVQSGAIPPVDTATASTAWFGAINEVVTQWVLAERPGRLEAAYPTIRALLLHGILATSPVTPAAPSVTAPASTGGLAAGASSTVDAAPPVASAAQPAVATVAPTLGDAPPGAVTTSPADASAAIGDAAAPIDGATAPPDGVAALLHPVGALPATAVEASTADSGSGPPAATATLSGGRPGPSAARAAASPGPFAATHSNATAPRALAHDTRSATPSTPSAGLPAASSTEPLRRGADAR
jgi:AcrR family transcriptional regulator